MKIILIGSVTSSMATLEILIEHNMSPVAVFGYEPAGNETVSGYVHLQEVCARVDITYHGFRRINECYNQLAGYEPDLIFAVGLSQLISKEILDLPALGVIGFHPTSLPAGRGRAPIAWIILDRAPGAATFFLMGENIDDGPVFVREPFTVNDDDASGVEALILESLKKALNRWLPELKRGIWNPVPQNELDITFYGARRPEDGLIRWTMPAKDIDRLIKASTHPHPGAFSFVNDQKITVWKSRVEKELRIKGVPGRILLINDRDELLVQTGNGLLWLMHVEAAGGHKFRVGQKLGYDTELEINTIKAEIENIKGKLET